MIPPPFLSDLICLYAPPANSTPAILAFEHTGHISASGPLYLLFLLLMSSSPDINMANFLSYLDLCSIVIISVKPILPILIDALTVTNSLAVFANPSLLFSYRTYPFLTH